MRLLVVEPDERALGGLQAGLEAEGYVVDVVGSRSAAQTTMLSTEAPAVVLEVLPTRGDSSADDTVRPVPSKVGDRAGPDDLEIWFG